MNLFGIPLHRKIQTGHKHISWGAVFILTLMWFTWGFNIFAGGQALTFTIQKYSKDPRIITIVMTVTGVLMISPIISYMSDQIWTRLGRRKPFLIVAWVGGFIAMTSFAFLPQVKALLDHVLGAVGIPAPSELVMLAIIIGCYKKAWDGCATIEPLFMECVPPHQRGRFFAMRGQVFTCAVLLFYQVLWPRYDVPVDQFAWLGHPGKLIMTGEQSIYILAASLFLTTGVFVVFCVEEVKMPTAPNKAITELFFGERFSKQRLLGFFSRSSLPSRAREASVGDETLMQRVRRVPIVTFAVNFARDVFLRTECYPFYIVLVIPGIEAAVWGNFNPLMQNDQFQYSKQAQADWAFPIGLLSMFVLTPLAGWYSDVRVKVPWWMRITMLFVAAISFVTMLWVVKTYSPADIRALPGFGILTLVTVLTALSMVMVYVPMVETLLDYVGREHARAWVSVLTVIKSMLNVGMLYLWIQLSPGQVPPIMHWMVFSVLAAALGTLMDTFIAPMIFDYMPRSQMGTINSGSGIYSSLIQFGAANLGAWWIVFFTTHIHKPEHVEYDYTSMYLLQFLLFIPAIWAKVYFIRLIVKGKMKKWGAMEMEGDDAQKPKAEEAQPAAV